ncbi:MAG: nucleoside hydrolase, partial [bacterium]
MAEPIKLIIDTDPGVDDAVAILMALAVPEIKILGLTTVGGNVPLARTTRNALALLQAAGRSDIPVAKGASRPLRGRFKYAPQFHGPGGLSHRLPDPSVDPVTKGAVEFLYDQVTADEPGEVTVVALGPLTNIAQLFWERPFALEQAKNIIVMGGAVNAPGNVTPKAEFNIYSDPVAAEVVIASGLPITLVDLAACRQVGISREQAMGLRSDHPMGRLTLNMLQGWFRKEPSRQRFEFYDPLAMAIALEPAIATVTKV